MIAAPVIQMSVDQCVLHAALHFQAEEGAVLAQADQAATVDHPVCFRVEHAQVGRTPDTDAAGIDAENPGRMAGDVAQRLGQWQAGFARPFQRQRQQQFNRRRARFGFLKRQFLGVIIDRCATS